MNVTPPVEQVISRPPSDLPRDFPRRHLPHDLEIRSFNDIEPYVDELLEADISTHDRLLGWLEQYSEVYSVLGEYAVTMHIQSTTDSSNGEVRDRMVHYLERIEPEVEQSCDRLYRKLVSSPVLDQLDPDEFAIFVRDVRNTLRLFREDNVPLETEVSKLIRTYHEIMGAITVEFEGERHTPKQLTPILMGNDRRQREKVFRAIWGRRDADSGRIDEVFDRLLELRERIARNAGFADFRAYQWRLLRRFDYTVDDCLLFHRAVEEHVLPAVERIRERRREALGVDALRHWDLACDLQGRPPLRPFETVDQLTSGCSSIFHRIDAELGEQFDRLVQLELLDLESRPGKTPGGYQSTLREARLPFIFANVVGTSNDVRTVLHEAGHAFHAFAHRNHFLVNNRGGPMEFNEVASKTMELLGHDLIDEFYQGEDLIRARRDFLEGVITGLAQCAEIDLFQHWLYTHPGHTHQQRRLAWVDCARRFDPGVDWSGVEALRENRWQMIGHLFRTPFYFIEYGIAQLGALQIWLRAREDRQRAIAAYRRALALGRTRPLPELYEIAGARFDFGPETIAPLVRAVEDELDAS